MGCSGVSIVQWLGSEEDNWVYHCPSAPNHPDTRRKLGTNKLPLAIKHGNQLPMVIKTVAPEAASNHFLIQTWHIVASEHLAFWCWFMALWWHFVSLPLLAFLGWLQGDLLDVWLQVLEDCSELAHLNFTMSSLWVPLDLGQRQCTMVPPTSICTTMSMVCLAGLCFLTFSLPKPSPSGVGIGNTHQFLVLVVHVCASQCTLQMLQRLTKSSMYKCFSSWKPPFGSRIFQLATFDDTGG